MGNKLGRGDPDYDSDELPTPRTRGTRRHNFIVRCPEGDDMFAKIPRELGGVWKVQRMCGESQMAGCCQCGIDIDQNDVRYVCNTHHMALCIDCAREQLGLPVISTHLGEVVSVEPGDILLNLSNTSMMIHHVILARGGIINEPLNPRDRNYLRPPPGAQILGLETIESSTEGSGRTTSWIRGVHYFMRDLQTAQTRVVAHLSDFGEFEVYEEPTIFKLLLNPVREELQGPGYDKALFAKVIAHAADESKPWAANTGLASQVFLKSGIFQPSYYNSEDRRAELLQRIVQERDAYAGVCTSVPIIAWQDYFMQAYEQYPDYAAQMILAYMPLSAERAVPSEMVMELTKHGWVVQQDFEPGKLQ